MDFSQHVNVYNAIQRIYISRRLARTHASIYRARTLHSFGARVRACQSQLVIIEADLINEAGNCERFSQQHRQIEWHCQAGIRIIHRHAQPGFALLWCWGVNFSSPANYRVQNERVRRFAQEDEGVEGDAGQSYFRVREKHQFCLVPFMRGEDAAQNVCVWAEKIRSFAACIWHNLSVTEFTAGNIWD